MIADEHTNFRNIVAASDKLKARWHLVTEKMISEGRSLLGIHLNLEDLIQLPSTRLAVLTEDPLSATWLDEARKLERVKAHQKQVDLKAALESGEDEAHAELNRLPRADRLTRARELGLDGGKTPPPSSVADEATLLRRLLTLSPQQRISKGREWGLIT